MDRKAWIAVTLSVIGLLASLYYNSTHQPPPAPPAAPPPAAVTPAITAAPAAEAPANAPAAPATASLPEQTEEIANGSMTLRFTSHGGGIAQAVLGGRHTDPKDQPLRLNGTGAIPVGALTAKPGQDARAPYEMRREGGSVIFTRNTPEGLRITKKFTPAAEGAAEPFATELEVTVENTSPQPRSDSFFLHSGSASPIVAADMPTYTRFDWLAGGKFHKTDASWFEASTIPLIGYQTSPAKAVFAEAIAGPVRWFGVTNQFYATILTPLPDKPTEEPTARSVWATRFDVPSPDTGIMDPKHHVWAVTGAMELAEFKLAPGASQTMRFRVFTGPKEYGRLTALGRGEEEISDFGMFRIFSVFLLNSMNFLYRFLGNYALAIIVLTVLIKAALWPLQAKALRTQKQMSLLGPKIKELQAKYPDDPARVQRETMETYKTYGVSPFGGCLPTVAQMPIFFGFYSMLGTAVELRHSSFLWVKDLSLPDTVGHIFGLPVNPLPLLMAATMFWQMRITPKTGDQQQQKIFMIMPLIFVLFCYNFAAALALYWTVQNILSVVQTYLTRGQPLPNLVPVNRDEKPANARVVNDGRAGKKPGKPART